MIRIGAIATCIAAFFAATAPAGGQDARTQAPCSPVIDRTQGNVTINFAGGCSVGITPVQLQEIIASIQAGRSVPPELLDRYDALSQKFGVTDAAVAKFFHILGQNKVATEDLDAKLREIAAQHLTLLKQAEAQAGDDPQVAALKTEAVAAIAAGDYARAQTLLQQAFDADLVAAKKAMDAANQRYVTAAKTKADLGQLKMAQLQYAAAAQDFQAAAELVPASAPLIRAEYLTALGLAASSQGNYPLARAGIAEALAIREKALTPDDTKISECLRYLALLDGALGHYAESESLSKRALAIDEKVLGPDHPDVAAGLTALVIVYSVQSRYAQAEPLAKRALAIAEKAFGPENSVVATYVNNLGQLAGQQARFAEAEPLFKRALAIDEKALGPEHPLVARALNNVATICDLQGRHDEAEPLYKRALAIDEKLLGAEHPDVAIELSNLATHYKLQGRYADAEPLLTRADAILEKALGPEHPSVATNLDVLGLVYQALGRTAEAEKVLQRALAIDEKVLGPDHPSTRETRRDLEAVQHGPAAQPAGAHAK